MNFSIAEIEFPAECVGSMITLHIRGRRRISALLLGERDFPRGKTESHLATSVASIQAGSKSPVSEGKGPVSRAVALLSTRSDALGFTRRRGFSASHFPKCVSDVSRQAAISPLRHFRRIDTNFFSSSCNSKNTSR